MELQVAVPETWSLSSSERGWTTYVSPDRSIELVVAPLIEGAKHDLQTIAVRGLARDARLDELVCESLGTTRGGNQMTATTYGVLDASGVEIERRYTVSYGIMWLVGTVMFVGHADALERHAELVDGLVRAVRPQLRSRRRRRLQWFFPEDV